MLVAFCDTRQGRRHKGASINRKMRPFSTSETNGPPYGRICHDIDCNEEGSHRDPPWAQRQHDQSPFEFAMVRKRRKSSKGQNKEKEQTLRWSRTFLSILLNVSSPTRLGIFEPWTRKRQSVSLLSCRRCDPKGSAACSSLLRRDRLEGRDFGTWVISCNTINMLPVSVSSC